VPRNEQRVRVERGLYKAGKDYYACATPPGGRTAVWKGLGAVGLMEARRLRDKFSAEVQGAPATVNRTRATFGELAFEWLAEQKARRESGEMSPRTYEAYELALRRHVMPVLGSRQPSRRCHTRRSEGALPVPRRRASEPSRLSDGGARLVLLFVWARRIDL
jgi:hypothetical protein